MGNLPGLPYRHKLADARAAVRRGTQRYLRSAIDLLFPPICTHCRCEIDSPADEILFCDRCRLQFADQRTSCRFCGAGIAEGVNPDNRCLHCINERFRFATVIRLGDYEGPLHNAILAAKQSQRVALAMHLGRLLAEVRRPELQSLACDAVVAVPSHWLRRNKHGHNSAEGMARQVAVRLGLPLADHLLSRIRATRPQTELAPRERRTNVKGAFAVRRHPDLQDAKLLLVDDVMTTGATANEVSRSLIEAGAGSVAVAVLARAVGHQ